MKKNINSYPDFRIEQKDRSITEEQLEYIKKEDPRPESFYLLPNISQKDIPGRPIVSANSHPTENISEFVDYQLQPLVQLLPSYLRDTAEFWQKWNQWILYLLK